MPRDQSMRVVAIGLVAASVSLSTLAQEPLVDRPRLRALVHGTLGGGEPSDRAPLPAAVTPPGSYALSIDGDFELGGFVFQGGYAFLHNDGGVAAGNTALGLGALVSLTLSGFSYGLRNTALGQAALTYTTTGYDNTAVGSGAMEQNTGGLRNTAIGTYALRDNTTGLANMAAGAYALSYNTTGGNNTAAGYLALASNTTGGGNTATGMRALWANTTGQQNVASGLGALSGNTTGQKNAALGYGALALNTTGSYNTGLGHGAGHNNRVGSSNVWINSYGYDPGGDGVPAEDHTLRIGNGTGSEAPMLLARAFISGISGVTLAMTEPPVCIDAETDQLGLCNASSARFKEGVREVGEEGAGVLGLHPVRFRYTEEFAGPGERPVLYGLVAEEVAELFPGLVTRDEEGRPSSVLYSGLVPLLLSELQRQERTVTTQEERIAAQEALIQRLMARMEDLERQAAITASQAGRGRSPAGR